MGAVCVKTNAFAGIYNIQYIYLYHRICIYHIHGGYKYPRVDIQCNNQRE